MISFTSTRAAALERLAAFVPQAGFQYASQRNYDRPGHDDVSRLSPYLRHRVLTEAEVLEAVLARHSRDAADKFVSEVFWRTYWKGVLELRPSLWIDYKAGVAREWDNVQTQSGLRQRWEEACYGNTGIEAFDMWAGELVETGYLHNHSRMWFASIWIFTLGLPWQLGADFFLRHLHDGDPASNTLSWRWVAGLQTRGKNYVARAENIARYTEGRLKAPGLNEHAIAIDGDPLPPVGPVPQSDPMPHGTDIGLLLTEDDMAPAFLFEAGLKARKAAVLTAAAHRSPLSVAPHVIGFTGDLADDLIGRLVENEITAQHVDHQDAVVAWAQENAFSTVVMPYAPVGPAADALLGLRHALSGKGITLSVQIRRYDAKSWPVATAGFFKLKKIIPKILDDLSL